ncbi:hypothetical protein D3C80_1366440 [compost metagenome]
MLASTPLLTIGLGELGYTKAKIYNVTQHLQTPLLRLTIDYNLIPVKGQHFCLNPTALK